VNNFADPEAVLTECFRVAKPHASLVLTTNPTGHMREVYALFREALLELQKSTYLERLRRNEEHRGTKESLGGMLQAAGFHVVKRQEGAFQLRYVDGSALFHHVLTQVGFLEGWRQVVDPEDEEQVFALLETRLNQVAQTRGELCLTVPMLYLEAEKPVWVQPLSVVDKSDISPTRLTALSTRLILASQGTHHASHFKQRGFVWSFTCSWSCLWSVSSSLWRCCGVLTGSLFGLPPHQEAPSAPRSTVS
jgi:hypothetical protein